MQMGTQKRKASISNDKVKRYEKIETIQQHIISLYIVINGRASEKGYAVLALTRN